jgi:arsenite/tail-anchored protein-transporting ATPase
VPLPFVQKGDIELKKVGLEVIVRVGSQKRTIMLPSTMSSYRPAGARFEEGALRVDFERSESGAGTGPGSPAAQ